MDEVHFSKLDCHTLAQRKKWKYFESSRHSFFINIVKGTKATKKLSLVWKFYYYVLRGVLRYVEKFYSWSFKFWIRVCKERTLWLYLYSNRDFKQPGLNQIYLVTLRPRQFTVCPIDIGTTWPVLGDFLPYSGTLTVRVIDIGTTSWPNISG